MKESNSTEKIKIISNKDTILEEINKSLKKNKNPSIEYLITKPYGLYKLPFGLGSIA